MKLHSLILGLTATAALPALGSASTMTFNFLNDVSASSTGVAVSSPHSFTDTQGDRTTITASVVGLNGSQFLFEKKSGGDENGLGISGEDDNEINANAGSVKLDLNSLLALHPTSLSITLGSVQGGEAGLIDYGNTTNGFNVTDENAHALNLSTLSADGGYVEVSAKTANVLIGSVSATVPSSAVPEPANTAMLGLGLFGAGAFLVRRKVAASR